MNKDRRDKKQKKKKADECSIGDVIITDNLNSDFSYLSTFKMDSLFKKTSKTLAQSINSRENNKHEDSTVSKGNEKNNAEESLKVAQKIIQLCESI